MPTTYVSKGQQYAKRIQTRSRKNILSTSIRENQVLLYSRPVLMEGTKNFQRENLSWDSGFSFKVESVYFYSPQKSCEGTPLPQYSRVQTSKLRIKPGSAEITNSSVCDHQGRPSALPSAGSQRPSLGGTFADATSAWPSHRPRAPAGGDRLKGTASCSASKPFIQIRYFSVMYFSPMDPGAHPSSTWAWSPPVTT